MSVSFPKPLTLAEEEHYISLYESGDEDAKDVLIERNLRLVAHIAKKYTGTGFPGDDLISIGTIGLIKAVNTYSSKKATRLATYAAKCIENEILMSIRSSKKNKAEVSLSVPIGTDKDGNEISFNDILGTDPDAILDDISLKIQVGKLLQAINTSLTPREKTVVLNRYGIFGHKPRTQREVAALLGISRSYVSRIEKKALLKLREELKYEMSVGP
ncbi:RNA polymerase sporulation sigma factor SigK [Anaerovorax odorimutans]|uniref:RNA polymerase sigma factor n=1 Tax=Anaerovorax odorimutans TaxID=109327 RepID=A0ABT1RSD9_9FIRM|nr:RNA polymerase sporulation sigma factor SigK [Anaerovorax odorimutans]MCQ4638082.1 RNA polymerase sporulation sigma factor SigK [Anaerovorax odorimutans]